MIAISGHAYPWDVLGDPDFAGRVAEFGIPEVTLAAAYHSVRAATPLHPAHRLVAASHAALYRPVRAEVWGTRRLCPLGPDWLTEDDAFAAAADRLRAAGLRVSAWIVLTHNTRLGARFGDVAVTNCFGDRYSYALCPAAAEVREYAATLAAEAVAGVAVDGVSLEACGQLGVAHNSHHEKTDGAWPPDVARLLSVCCCGACRAAWADRGLDPAEVTGALRAAATGSGELADGLAAELMAVRQHGTDLLRAEVLDRLAEAAPGVPVILHGHPDPWVTGPSPGLTPAAVREGRPVLVQTWPTDDAGTEAAVAAIAAVARAGLRADAYVTVLPPADPERLAGHVRRLVAAGAGGLALYHLGLAPAWLQPAFRDLVAMAGWLG